MCGRVRLSSDYSEIKIRLKFDLDAPAPNFEPDWNKPPTAPMLVAIRSVDGKRIPKMMKWGLIPRCAKVFDPQRAIGGVQEQARIPRRMEAWPAVSRRHRWLLRVEGARSQGQEKTALRDRDGRRS
jgi:putative SOS response-associated peptidase YedK